MHEVIGWDIGGAHLKLARVRDGALMDVRQVPCALWQGLDRLTTAIPQALSGWAQPRAHAVTMTGELADLFPDRATGVRAILATLRGSIAGEISVYGTDGAFFGIAEAASLSARVGSANWHAAARFAAIRLGHGLFVDIGSTTTDLVALRGGQVAARGLTDADRLAVDELVYQGVVRTPVMAVARHLFFAGERVGVMAEQFAGMSDVYRLMGVLPADADQHATSDGRGKSETESRTRLARMVGRDAAAASEDAWAALARQLASRQIELLQQAAERVLSGAGLPAAAPLLGAGVGRFLAEELAHRLGLPYRSFAELVATREDLAAMAATCAPATAVALLRSVA